MSARYPVSIVWMRRDLRLDDHVALYRAAGSSERVACAFVLDPPLLRGPRVGPPIVQVFFDALRELRERVRAAGSDLAVLEGDFAGELLALAKRVGAAALFFNDDTDPDAIARDDAVSRRMRAAGIAVHRSVDHVYYAPDEVLQRSGKPYTVFTPYRRAWLERFAAHARLPVPSQEAVLPKLLGRDAIGRNLDVPRPERFGHASSARYPRGGVDEGRRLLNAFLHHAVAGYGERRNVPALDGTSRLSPHLRSGTLGIRAVVHAAAEARRNAADEFARDIDTWIAELIWRDFFHQLLAHYPRIAYEPFLSAGADIAYADDPRAYAAWCAGRTGYPIVDAAMTQLNETGWMHNRLRMIAASFLTKHVLTDYHLGERYFEQRLADADLAANNGGWQWSASTGTDAAPYFRIFNPTLQGKTFDPSGAFVRAMLPALARIPARYVHEPWTLPPLLQAEYGCVVGREYPAPIVDHAVARRRALEVYGAALGRRHARARMSSP